MASTVIELYAVVGTTTAYLDVIDGTGTPAASYTVTQVSGQLHSITVVEAITGRVSVAAGDSDGTQGFRLLDDLTDTATTFAIETDTAAAIADAVWDEAQSGHVTAGTFGLYLDAQVSRYAAVGGSSSRTEYLRWTTALTLYAKKLPLSNPWADDVVTATESVIDPGSYAFDVDAGQYEIFQMAGGAPAATDTAIGSIDAAGGYTADTLAAAIRAEGLTVTVTSPLATDGSTLTLVQGDDYHEDDTTASGVRAVEFTGDIANQWPDLTGATIEFSARDTTVTGEVTSPTGIQSVRVEFTNADTLTWSPGCYGYSVKATLATTERIITLIQGTLEVIRR